MSRLRLGVLVSGSGTNMQAILDASLQNRIPVEVAVVLSNRPKALALERARKAGVPIEIVSHRSKDRQTFEKELVDKLRTHKVECVALAGFMRLLSGEFLSAFPGRVINIHPSLLPAFPGMNAQRQALDYGVKFTGCTVHFVDEGEDSGPIIAQAIVPVLDSDDEEALRKRILEQEHRLYPWVLGLLAENRIQMKDCRVLVDTDYGGS
ncbi:MAG: phosphoribosylglycinamide formyltransferase [Pseudomonadota bacterium]